MINVIKNSFGQDIDQLTGMVVRDYNREIKKAIVEDPKSQDAHTIIDNEESETPQSESVAKATLLDSSSRREGVPIKRSVNICFRVPTYLYEKFPEDTNRSKIIIKSLKEYFERKENESSNELASGSYEKPKFDI